MLRAAGEQLARLVRVRARVRVRVRVGVRVRVRVRVSNMRASLASFVSLLIL